MRAHRFALVLAASGIALAASAQVLKFDPDIGAAPGGPPRNATIQEVEARYGPPVSRTGPVGDPPITVWHYEQFKVYFEYDRVLHATARKSGPAPGG